MNTLCNYIFLVQVDDKFYQQQMRLERSVLAFLRSRIQERVNSLNSYSRSGSPCRTRATLAHGVGEGTSDRRGQGGRKPAATSVVNVDVFLRNQTRPDAVLATVDWHAVVQHIHKGSPSDGRTVGFLVKEAASRREREDLKKRVRFGEGEDAQEERSSVSFGVFMQVLLGYQLHVRLRRLRFFKEDFKEVCEFRRGER